MEIKLAWAKFPFSWPAEGKFFSGKIFKRFFSELNLFFVASKSGKGEWVRVFMKVNFAWMFIPLLYFPPSIPCLQVWLPIFFLLLPSKNFHYLCDIFLKKKKNENSPLRRKTHSFRNLPRDVISLFLFPDFYFSFSNSFLTLSVCDLSASTFFCALFSREGRVGKDHTSSFRYRPLWHPTAQVKKWHLQTTIHFFSFKTVDNHNKKLETN